MMLWLIDTLTEMREGRVVVGRLVIMTQRRASRSWRNAFELGVDAGTGGLVKPKPPAARVRRLHSV
ncbi:hypothetical protein ACOACQ_17630 [Nocardioides sp. CPCC 206347]|uniref:hypothetical protein n=1 Tax=Nocardioides sp. CPCC 206347 TaxID=3406463 RepID=UPI003B430114